MDLPTLMAVCQAYRNMGDAVIDQLKDVVADDSEESLSRQNGNALRRAASWLQDVENIVYGPAAEQAHDLRERINAWVNDQPEPPRREV